PAFMAFFMPEHAVAAVFLPLAWEVVRGLGLKQGDRYAQSVFLALAWGAVIGGVATLLGGARGPLAMALVQELTGKSFSFLDWSLASAPLVASMLAIGAVLLLFMTPVNGLDIQAVRKRIEQKRLELGLLNWQGRIMALLMLVTIAAWLSAGYAAGLASIALISVVCMFALRLVSWKEIQAHVSWDVIMLYGGAIAIGKAIAVTGAGVWLASWLLPAGAAGLGLLFLLALATLLLTESVSNSAAVAIMLPVAIPAGLAAGMNPVAVSMAVGIVAGFAFMLPMGTPPNAMIFSTGYVKATSMLRYGAMMSIAAFTLFALTVWLWWPVAGIGVIK
ncbi:MAG: SLC13 family permease, partial [Mariprofundaceae bacterium]|nr:SLC13 family permease [Mariprofundaceae bacterium]